jgi:hypothetical protein
MKFKSLARIGGACEAAVGIYMGQFGVRSLPLSYSILEDSLSGKVPPEYVVLGATLVTVEALAIPVCGLLATDGLLDVVTGYHHYFGLKMWKRLTKNEKTKDGIDDEIKKMSILKERDVSFSKKEE